MKGGKSKADSRKADSRLAVKKQTKKEKQAAKDPNKPKRAASAFFVFMEDFRKRYKEKHPNNKSVAAVGKAGGDEWKSMSKEDKAPFVAVAEQRKEEYERQMKAYNKKLAGEEDEESDKSKSEVNDEEDEEGSGEVSVSEARFIHSSFVKNFGQTSVTRSRLLFQNFVQEEEEDDD
ncbi:HMG1/2-like protein isoform X1 [Salvia miltiorrhiza]|uniref:HMG1/2-like protein isoform X1 n=1 Tax=Salvia miltiorrhiza TaxID=226208 RepID=UPI0025AD60B5|nr:HMG1/2-like protein isoform X1 [Salvia miltiorrhiza]